MSYNLAFQDDTILGALDYNSEVLNFGVDIPMSSFLLFKPSVTFGTKKYETFVADVIDNPRATEKRKDQIRSYQLPIVIKISSFSLLIQFENTLVRSNYDLEGYFDNKIEVGVSYDY